MRSFPVLACLLAVAPLSAAAQSIDVADVKAVLDRYDANTDGTLAGPELESCACGHFDLDQDGAVNLAEFTGGIIIYGEPKPPETSLPQVAAATDTVSFVNSPDGLSGELAANYVPFSFEYPAGWEVMESGREPGASNFVKVEKSVDGFTGENFAVGYFTVPPAAENDPEVLGSAVDLLHGQLAQGFPNFQPVATGPASLGNREGRYFTFSSHVEETPKGPIDIWGRTLLIPAGGGRGVVVMMLATKIGTELRGPGDIGRIGELPLLLESFRFGDQG